MKWYALAVMGGAAFGGLLWAGLRPYQPHSHTVPVAEAPSLQGTQPDMRVEGMHLLEQVGTATGWEVVAKKAALYDAEQLAVLHQLQAKFFGQPAGPLHMTATHGQINRGTGDIAVHGGVRLQYQTGYTIETETLYWRAADRVLYTDVPVQIRSTSIYVVGTGLHSNVDQQRIVLQHSVQASFQLR